MSPRPPIPRREERLVLAEAGERWMFLYSNFAWGRPWGTKFGQVRVLRAVLVGTLRDRPRTTAQIARVVGFPRQTIERRLSNLAKEGFIVRAGRGWMTADYYLYRVPDILEKMITDIQITAEELRKLNKG